MEEPTLTARWSPRTEPVLATQRNAAPLPRRRRDWGAWISWGGAVLVAGYLCFHVSGLGGAELRETVAGAVFLPLGAAATVLAVRAARHRDLDARARRAWLLIAFAFGLLLQAHATSFWYTGTGGYTTLPSLSNVGVLGFVPAVLAGLLVLPVMSRPDRRRTTLVLDIVTAVTAGFMLVWYLVLGPLLVADDGSALLPLVIAVAYPVGDLVLILGVSTVLLRGVTPRCRRPLSILGTGLGLFVAADLVDGYAGQHPGFAGASWAQPLWLAASLLFLLAANDQHFQFSLPARLDMVSAARRAYGAVAPYVAVAIGYTLLLLLAHGQHSYPVGVMLVAALVLTGAVAVRQFTTMRDNHHRSIVDPLTGLANHLMVRERLTASLVRSSHTGRQVAVLMIDLDRFKPINETMGHEAGDALLVAVARSISSVIRLADTAGRVGGDKFVLVLGGIEGVAPAQTIADRVLSALRTPVVFDGHIVSVGASIGIAISDDDTSTAQELLHRAEVALVAAKRTNPGGYQVYTPRIDSDALAAELRRAIKHDELIVHYQPIIDIATGETVSVEALVRWQHPTRGMVAPDEFIPFAEETGLILPLGNWVLRQACSQVMLWSKNLPAARGLTVSINMSPRQVCHPSMVSEVTGTLRKIGFDPSKLILEITEGSVLSSDTSTIAKIEALRGLGVRVAVDDFGTGYSSLSYLRRFPIDVLKIDRALVADMLDSEDGRTVGTAVVNLGQALRLEVVAEGIESMAQLDTLRELRCTLGQGFHFTHPLGPDGMEEFLRQAEPAGSV